jgi:Protein of unknown function (DUF4238)
MARHHFVPQFLLRHWATNGKFVSYHFEISASRVIENPKAIVASACQIENLNTFFGVPASQRDFPETQFLTPRVDTPAAAALQVMLANGVRALSAKQRIDWARLLVSFAVRTPETLREMGPNETARAFDLVEAAAKGPPDDERKVTAIIQKNITVFKRNFPLYAAMELSTDPQKLATINSMTWWVRRWPRPSILIGDRPLLTAPRARYSCGIPLDDTKCLIVLPIAPHAVFFASANPKTKDKVRKLALSKIACVVNEETIWRASCIYFLDKSLSDFLTARIAGKATGTWEASKL